MINSYEGYLREVNNANRLTKMYDKSIPAISDKAWDELYFSIKEYEERTGRVVTNSPTQIIIYEEVNELRKVEHNHDMLSCDKTKDWIEFIKYFNNKDVTGMLKLDGLTCSLRYVDGRLKSAETRGNGKIGEDILHNAYVIKSIPREISYKEEFIVDGEVICTNYNFEAFKEEYANPRNFAAGSIRLLDSHECSKRNLTFVVWNIVKGFEYENSFIKKLENVSELGFNIVPFTSSFDYDAKDFLIEQAKDLGYPIDGLVGRFDDIKYGNSLGQTSHHTRAIYAFKFYDEYTPSTLLDIEYDVGRTGVLTPVAVFKPIEIEGSVVEKASLHNLSIMKNIFCSHAYKGDIVNIFKANSIIPQVLNVFHHEESDEEILIPKTCPICGEPLSIVVSESGVETLVCENANCAGKVSNIIKHYCSRNCMDIKGLSEKTIDFLLEKGWINDYTDLYLLKYKRTEWINMPGFGPRSVDKVLEAIEVSRNTTLERFIAAIGIPLIGTVQAKEICKHIDSYDDFVNKVQTNYDWTNINGFSYARAQAIKKFNYSYANGAFSFLNFEKPVVEEVSNNKLNGITVCITGKLSFGSRDKFKTEIEKRGGKVTGSVSRKTNYLINNDNNSESSKNKTAISYGVEVITENEFISKFFD